jgi:hypothetical protein
VIQGHNVQKSYKQPRDIPDRDIKYRDIKYRDIMTKISHILGDVMKKEHNESRDILIQGRFIQKGTL